MTKEEKKLLKLQKKQEKQDKKLNKENARLERERIDGNIKDEEHQEHEIKMAPIREKRRLLNEPPVRSTLEEIGNSVTHGVGAIFAIVALVLMLIKSDTGLKITASLVYGLCMFFMMLMSSLYHAFPKGSTVKRIWRRFDYTSIYLLIGGTFAPLLLVNWPANHTDSWNQLGYYLFIAQWVIILTGVTMVCIFGPGRIKWLNFPLYFLIGWSGVMFIPGWIENDMALLLWILGGGIVYTLGMIPFVMNKVKAAHFIWHFFVLAGCICQFVGIYLVVYLGAF